MATHLTPIVIDHGDNFYIDFICFPNNMGLFLPGLHFRWILGCPDDYFFLNLSSSFFIKSCLNLIEFYCKQNKNFSAWYLVSSRCFRHRFSGFSQSKPRQNTYSGKCARQCSFLFPALPLTPPDFCLPCMVANNNFPGWFWRNCASVLLTTLH